VAANQRNLADPLALAAERVFERAGGLDLDADARRDQPHRFDGAPLRHRQQLLAHSVAAQHQFTPVQRFQRDRDAFGGSGRGAIDAAMGIDRRPDGRRAQAQDDDDEQAADKLKDEAHAITPQRADESNSTANSRQMQAGEAHLGKFSQSTLGICLWTRLWPADLTKPNDFHRGPALGGNRLSQPGS
jgi:hypothetical protein